jgi:hypothetical protein
MAAIKEVPPNDQTTVCKTRSWSSGRVRTTV